MRELRRWGAVSQRYALDEMLARSARHLPRVIMSAAGQCCGSGVNADRRMILCTPQKGRPLAAARVHGRQRLLGAAVSDLRCQGTRWVTTAELPGPGHTGSVDIVIGVTHVSISFSCCTKKTLPIRPSSAPSCLASPASRVLYVPAGDLDFTIELEAAVKQVGLA